MENKGNREGKSVIITAPSGAGKTTIVRYLLEKRPDLSFSISATTRQPRGSEKDGVDYFFLTAAEFRSRIERNAFVEWEEVYNDLYYGTLRTELERIWLSGNHVLFDVDVKGGLHLKKIFRSKSLSIFIMPPSVEELEKRLLNRATDSVEKIRMRVEKAKEELKMADSFDRIIINDDLKRAKYEAFSIVTDFLETVR